MNFIKPILILLFPITLSAQWTTLSLSSPRADMAGAYVQGKVLFAGGFNTMGNASTVSSAVDIFDQATKTWSAAQLGTARSYIGSATLGDRVILAGGLTTDASGNQVPTDVVDIYNAVTNTWTQTSLPEPVFGLQGATIGNKSYFASHDGALEDIFVFDGDTDTWSMLTLPGGPRHSVGICALGTKLFIAGGFVSTSGIERVKTINIYDTATDTWDKKDLRVPRASLEAISSGNYCFFSGGEQSSPTGDLDIYVSTTDEMIYGSGLARYKHAAAVWNGDILLGGSGHFHAESSLVEVFQVSVFNFYPSGFGYPNNTKLWRQTAVSTPTGVFFAGGETPDEGVMTDQVFVFPPLTSATLAPVVQSLSVRPTLATDQVEVLLPSDLRPEQGVLSLTDASGALIQQWTFNTTDAGTKQIIDTGHLRSGYYVLKYVSGQTARVSRFIKQ